MILAHFTVVAFYSGAANYVVQKLPFNDQLFLDSRFVNFPQRRKDVLQQAENIIRRFQDMLNYTAQQIDQLQEEFTEYQLLDDAEIPDNVWKEAEVKCRS